MDFERKSQIIIEGVYCDVKKALNEGKSVIVEVIFNPFNSE